MSELGTFLYGKSKFLVGLPSSGRPCRVRRSSLEDSKVVVQIVLYNVWVSILSHRLQTLHAAATNS
jgi:hypothetical protein